MNNEVAVSRITDISARKTITVIGFGRRLLTALYDGFIIAFAGFLLTAGVGLLLLVVGLLDTGESDGFSLLAIACGVVLSIIYYVVSWTRSGQTVGKTLGGVTVVSTDGSPVSLWQALLRYVGYLVSGAVLSLGFLWIAFDRRRQGLHDKIARTYVVESDIPFSKDEDVEFVPSDPGKGWIWLAAWLITLLLAPGALFGSFWILGPLVIRAIDGLLGISE